VGKSVRLCAAMVVALLASVGALVALPLGPARGAAILRSGFTKTQVVSGLTYPMDMEFAPDGRLFVAEQAGRVRIAKPNGTLTTFLNISTKVDSNHERGLQALTFDPNFSTNGYVYLQYTKKATSTTPVHNRVVRVTASGDKAVAGSEKLIFKLGNQRSAHHMGGAIDFGNDGKLYISTGDNETPDKAQQLTNLFGKMLRINKDGTIPTGNPFYATASGKTRAIWARGLRNPFKFAIQPTTGSTTGPIFINDVGENTWEEINLGASGANYGWNLCEGNHDNPTTAGSVNCSAAPYTPPVHEYTHGSTDTTGCSITGGTFYNPTTGQFPSGYMGDYFFADLCSGWIRTYDPLTNAATGFATGLSLVVDLEVSKEGELYYLSRGSPGTVSKIGYTGN
jgi:glucose/arabinose dehydrogenase